MNYKSYLLLATVAMTSFACQKQRKEDDVISQTYIHKYGYAVSQKEWQEKNYPGQIISSLRNGVTMTATYENGELHGPCTFSYPHSNTVEKYVLYNQNKPVKEVHYDISGMPLQETVQLTENRHSLTTWYNDGVPKSVEEYVNDELVNGEYFTKDHEIETAVKNGAGIRTIRDVKGLITCKDVIEEGFLAKRESFYSTGSPESIATFIKGQLNGTRQTFTPQGEPLAIEEWVAGHLHGTSTYYKNGNKELEVSYVYGKKNGLEVHFLDGKEPAHQISWSLGLRHGPEVFFLPQGGKKTLWNYENKEVSQSRFQELTSLDAMILEAR
jgi:antitoxin component YwqK of YwqJK toxin-antitoxin module